MMNCSSLRSSPTSGYSTSAGNAASCEKSSAPRKSSSKKLQKLLSRKTLPPAETKSTIASRAPSAKAEAAMLSCG